MTKLFLTLLVSVFICLNSLTAGTKLGIGVVVDSTSNMSRSFALYELLKRNPLINAGDTLTASLTEYFPYATPFGITGIINKSTSQFKIFKQGKKYKEINTTSDWKNIYFKIAAVMAEFGYQTTVAFKTVDEGSMMNLGSGRIYNFMPGLITYEIPFSPPMDSLKKEIQIEYKSKVSPFESAREVYGSFITYKENDIFFFKNSNVPKEMRDAVLPLVYPRYNSLYPTLIYMADGYNLSNSNNAASMNLFFSALNSSNRLLASKYEKAKIRKMIFEELGKQYSRLKRSQTSSLFTLASELNKSYYKSNDGKSEKMDFKLNMGNVTSMAQEAENAARMIRAANWQKGISAANAAIAEISYASQGNKAGVDASSKQLQLALTEYGKQTSQARAMLDQKFKDIDKKINADYFISGEDTETGYMRHLITPEVNYFLVLSSSAVKSVMETYAADKPKLKTLIADYYITPEPLNQIKLKKLITYLDGWEREVINLEIRNLPVSISKYENKFAGIEPELDEALGEAQKQLIENQKALAEVQPETSNPDAPKILFIANAKSKVMIDGKLKAILEAGKPTKVEVNPGEVYVEVIPPFDESKKIAEVIKSPGKGEQIVKKIDFPQDVVLNIEKELKSSPSVFEKEEAILFSTKSENKANNVSLTINDGLSEKIVGKWKLKTGRLFPESYETLTFFPGGTGLGSKGFSFKWSIIDGIIKFSFRLGDYFGNSSQEIVNFFIFSVNEQDFNMKYYLFKSEGKVKNMNSINWKTWDGRDADFTKISN